MKKFGIFVAIVFVFATAVYYAKNSNFSFDTAEFSSRAPAFAGSAQQQQIIDEMNQVILSMKSRSDVIPAAEKIIELAKQDANSQMPGVQLYRAAASIVPDLEGVVYRCRAFVETSDWVHMSILYGLRDFSYNDYLYGPHIKALFDFVTYPSERVGKPFKTVSELQNFVMNTIAPKVRMFSSMLAQLESLPAENFEFQFDRTILVGQRPGLRFLDPTEAKKLFIKPNIYMIHFLAERALGSIYYLSAMDLDELPVVFNRVIKQTTINSFSGDLRLAAPAKGVTPEMTYEVIKNTRSFLSWKQNVSFNGQTVTTQQVLDSAFVSGVKSSYYQLAAYVCGIKYPFARAHGQSVDLDIKKDCMSLNEQNPSAYFVSNGSNYLMNPNEMTLDFKEKYHMLRDRTRAYLEAKEGKYAAITSDVTGQTIKVNIKNLFSTAHSQRDFLPTGYSSGGVSTTVPGLGVKAWNYDYGKPMTFKEKYHMLRDRTRAYLEAKEGKYAAITSDVTGQTIKVNIKNLFSTAHSQRDFLPTGYSSGGVSTTVPGLGVKAWNYDYGKPMTFKDYSFGGFFDSSEVHDPATLYRTMSTLLYTKSVAPFAIFIRAPSTAKFLIPPSEIVKE